MGLNKSSGNMYGFVDATWNTVKGLCPFSCSYCYMKRWGPQAPLHFDEAELKTDLGRDNFIFVGSSCDMWADEIGADWILDTLGHCLKYPKNKYLFQSKEPRRIESYTESLPGNSIIATTIETNRAYPEMGKAPPTGIRVRAIQRIKELGFKTMITIEPIMDFDLEDLSSLIFEAKPNWVNIGADSRNSGLWEPDAGKIKALIKMLSQFTEVRQKPNLKRLLKNPIKE